MIKRFGAKLFFLNMFISLVMLIAVLVAVVFGTRIELENDIKTRMGLITDNPDSLMTVGESDILRRSCVVFFCIEVR